MQIMGVLMVCLLLWCDHMQAKSHIGLRADTLELHTGYFLADTGYWKTAIMIIAAAFLMILLVTQFGNAARIEKGAEVAFSRAWQLLHDADRENRNVRPLPLSLARVEVPRQLS
jgi:hypothetical protein